MTTLHRNKSTQQLLRRKPQGHNRPGDMGTYGTELARALSPKQLWNRNERERTGQSASCSARVPH